MESKIMNIINNYRFTKLSTSLSITVDTENLYIIQYRLIDNETITKSINFKFDKIMILPKLYFFNFIYFIHFKNSTSCH